MSDSNLKPWKYLLPIGLLLFAGLFLYNNFGNGWKDDSATSEQPAADGNDKKKKKPLPDFLTRTPVLLPGVFQKNVNTQDELSKAVESDPTERLFSDPSNSALRLNRAKSGHWYSAHYPVVANHLNIDGELSTQTVLPTSQPVPVAHTRYWPVHKRPVALAKKEWKNLESSVFVPVRSDIKMDAPSVLVSFSLNQRNATLNQASTIQPVAGMKEFQHHFVVLTDRPDDWSYLKTTDSFQLAGKLGSGDLMPPVYHLVPSIPGDPVPLSRNVLEWTTIAYVLWDNLPENALDLDQQKALIDWLFHGGQLIISGPDCLDRLRNSFLAEHLPASFDGSINLTADEVETLNKHWSIPSTINRNRALTVPPTGPIPGVRFEPHPESQFVDQTGEIAIERQIGRGRIVMTSFSLVSPQVRDWGSFNSFLNGVLLRKPARKFGRNENLETNFRYANNSTTIYDPLLASTVRFLSRDLGASGTLVHADVRGKGDRYDSDPEFSGDRNLADTWHYGGYQSQQTTGVGGWNDFSAVAVAARRALREGAGIKPPSAEFVLKMLGGYLLVLVPLNWLFFRSIGKVEFAWVAAPMIAIAGAIGVVRMASLDIGFVRSNTELGLLEVFADHPRAHLTQYSALYTSLSTRYQAELDNATSQALPFAASRSSSYRQPNQQPFSTVTLRRSARNRLENLQVQSNSTGLLHIESMLDLEGAFSQPEKEILINSSPIALRASGVVRRSGDGKRFEVAWIGELESGQTVDLDFETVAQENLYQRWLINPTMASVSRQARVIWESNVPENRSYVSRQDLLDFPEIQEDLEAFQQRSALMEPSLQASAFSRKDFREIYASVQHQKGNSDILENLGAGDLFDAVTQNLTLGRGESRLLGVTDQALSLGSLEPEATQTRRQTLVVVHLSHPSLPKARRDVNRYQDEADLSDLDLEDEATLPEETVDEQAGP
jgi:hypothetical protein